MSRLIIDTKAIKGIPLNEYYLDGVETKGLVFVQHGFQSNKNRGTDYLAINLARLGYFVVSIDAQKHGERIEEPFISEADYLRYADAFYVVNQTSKDIIMLFEECYKDRHDVFDLIGVSMGGFIAFDVARKCSYVNKLIPCITTPYFYELANTRTNVPGVEKYQEVIREHLDFIERLDPSKHMEELDYSEMFLLSCTNDDVISYKYAERFYRENKNDSMSLKLYEDVHTVNRDMQVDILEFISNKKVTL